MSEGPWIRFFSSDWLAGTRGMTAAETGIYITLIAMMYERGGPIKNEPARLARLCGASNIGFKKALETLISEGKIIDSGDGYLSNFRVVEELSYSREKSALASASANARWGKKARKNKRGPDAAAYANASETHMQKACGTDANQKPEPDRVDVDTSTTVRKAARGTRISSTWEAREQERQWALDHGWDESEINDAEIRFRDYWLTCTGQNATKLDWDRTFLNRLKDLNDRRRPPIRGSPSNRGLDPMMQAFQKRFEQDDDDETGQGEIEAAGGTVRRLPATGTGGH